MYDLRTVRKEKKLTQEDLTGLLGLRQSTLAELETGRRTPRRQTIQKVESLFGPVVDWRKTLAGPDRMHIMYALSEFINEDEPGARQRVLFALQALDMINMTLKA